MTHRWLTWKSSSGRVARRIIATFLLCAFLPLLAFAWHAYHAVSDELETTADQRFRNDAKSSAVTLVERLRVAQVEFDALVLGTATAAPAEGSASGSLIARVLRAGESEDAPVLEAGEEALLPRHSSVLVVRATDDSEDEGTTADVWLAARAKNGDVLFADLIEQRLFDPDGFQRHPSDVFVATPGGRVIHRSGGSPTGGQLYGEREAQGVHGRLAWDQDGEARLGRYWEVFIEPQFGTNLLVASHDSHERVFAPLAVFERDLLLVAVATFLAVSFFSLVKVRGILDPIQRMIAMTRRVADEDFSARVGFTGRDEFGMLGRAFDTMAANLEHGADVLDRINHFGAALSTVRDPDRLLDELVRGASALFAADGTAVHTLDDDGHLRVARLSVESINAWITEEASSRPARPPEPPRPLGSEPPPRITVAEARAEATASLIAFAESHSYDLRGASSIPMLDHDGEVVGVLTLFNPHEGAAFGDDVVGLAESLASQASVAISNSRLVHEFKNLFDAFIELIAMAIDEKSPYTGGHCRRVPILAMMIADAAQAERDGPFASFALTEDQYYEMQVAAMLHDCGKVVTPVHVVDKATKLETIHDRIHLVDARFEVLKRDAEIALWRRLAEGKASPGEVRELGRELSGIERAIENDRDFLRAANVGGEGMSDEDVARVAAIASVRRWRGPDGLEQPLLTADEVENLQIRRGTLSAAERKIINDHIVATIRMLDRLPFPKNLRNVTAIAGAHHERMDGRGFPNGLRREEISVQGRILGLADVFEALTAADRPYKSGKTISEALDILGRMARDGHVDRDAFKLFIERKIYLEYACQHLKPDQIDAVDPMRIPGYADVPVTAAP